MTIAVESRPSIQLQQNKDPIAFLVACGLLEPRGTMATQLRVILKPYLPPVDELDPPAFLEARERVGKSLGPGETFAQIIIEMRGVTPC